VDASDQGDFESLYRAHGPAVLAYCLRRAPRDVAEEAVSETFMVAWRRRGERVHEPLPWLLGIARRVLANQRRAARRQRALTDRLAAEPLPIPTPPQARPVLDALSRLNEADQEVLRLAAWEELPSAEAARVLGCSAVAYRIRLHRARQRLARTLTELQVCGKRDPRCGELRVPTEETGP
jgi:RNA polymerase sigma-70 factor (ECF subfamily)